MQNSPFRSLRVQPSTDRGVVNIYAFDKYVASFHVLDNPNNPDRDTWWRLLVFIWNYGEQRHRLKRRWEGKYRFYLYHVLCPLINLSRDATSFTQGIWQISVYRQACGEAFTA